MQEVFTVSADSGLKARSFENLSVTKEFMEDFDLQVVTSPEELKYKYDQQTIFLAGGISGCPDWQREFIKLCKKEVESGDELVLINPRRVDFDITDPTMSEQQIIWEHNYLSVADTIIFWFPEETLCPITLFELGAALQRDQEIFIGTHPNYARRFDVVTQTKLANPNINVVSSLEDLVKELFYI